MADDRGVEAEPLTAVLMLDIGLRYMIDRSHTISPRGGTS